MWIPNLATYYIIIVTTPPFARQMLFYVGLAIDWTNILIHDDFTD